MSELSSESMLARLNGQSSDGPDPWPALAAAQPRHEPPARPAPAKAADSPEETAKDSAAQLDELLNRVKNLTSGAPAPTPPPEAAEEQLGFVPPEPKSFAAASLTSSEVESL